MSFELPRVPALGKLTNDFYELGGDCAEKFSESFGVVFLTLFFAGIFFAKKGL